MDINRNNFARFRSSKKTWLANVVALVVIVKLFKGQFSSFSHSLGLVLNGCEVIQFSVRIIQLASLRKGKVLWVFFRTFGKFNERVGVNGMIVIGCSTRYNY